MRPRLHPDAEAEYRAGAEWYDDDYPGRGDRFVDQVEASLARIREMPLAFPLWRRRSEIRACVVARFPYTLFFIAEPEGPMVYAIAHHKRRPGYWRSRLPTK